MKKHRVGIIVDSTSAKKQIWDFIKLSKTSANYEVSHLIVQVGPGHTEKVARKIIRHIRKQGIKRLLSKLAFQVLCNFERIAVKKFLGFYEFFENYDLNKFNLELVYVYPIVSNSGYVYRYSAKDLKKIDSLNLNLLVRAGSGILRGEILSLCENGIISFHHADNNLNRGGPPAFWETMQGEPRTGFIIQRLKNELDGGDVLYRGFVPTSWMYTINLIKLYEASSPFLHSVIDDITSETPYLTPHNKQPYCFPLYTTPSLFEQLSYLSGLLVRLIVKLFRKIMGRNYRWGVAYQFVENWRDVTLWRSKKIPNPPNRFLADPFVIRKNNDHFCFVEDYNHAEGRGCISVYRIDKDGSTELGVALDEEFHLSYPFMFEFNNNLYMCPETHEANDIRLYKCVDFPLRWELERILIPNVSGVDTNIFFRDDKWWLMTNISSSQIGDRSELHIFSSTTPLSSDWKPHTKNPVIFDSRQARNAGFLSDKSGQYRVFQRQGFDLYGESLGVSRIIHITEDEYEEQLEFNVTPNFFKKIKGTHTYNFYDGLLVFDYVEISSFRKNSWMSLATKLLR